MNSYNDFLKEFLNKNSPKTQGFFLSGLPNLECILLQVVKCQQNYLKKIVPPIL
jgi:hypothetical protein